MLMFITSENGTASACKTVRNFARWKVRVPTALLFKDVFIEDEDVIAAPEQFAAYIQSIKAGFILLQIGDIGAGVIDGSLEVIREADAAHAEANRYLDDDYDSLKIRLDGAWAETERLADLAWNNRPDNLATLKLRAAASELALAHRNPPPYMPERKVIDASPAQRRLRGRCSSPSLPPL